MSRFSQASLWNELSLKLPVHLRDCRAIKAAFDIAYEAHAGQFRAERDPGRTRIPYIVHPVGVAKLVIENWREGELDAHLDMVVSAALLHDVLEDSSFEYRDIADRTSAEVADLTRQLTKPQLVDGQHKEERNVHFAQQIVAGGPIAVYVKICDAAHNLSRPQGMPTTLLKKSMSKAQRIYLPMLAGMPFEARLTAKLQDALAACREVRQERSEEEREFDPFDFASIVTHIERSSRTKLFEVHDLVEVLGQIPGVVHALYGAPSLLSRAMTAAYPAYTLEFWDGLAIEGVTGIYKLPQQGKSQPSRPRLPFNHVLRLDEDIYGRADRSHAITLMFAESDVPSWFRPETIAAIVQVSTGKIDRHLQDNLLSVQSLGRQNNIDLAIDAVREYALSEKDIMSYVHSRDIGHVFMSQISYFVENLAPAAISRRPPQLQSRVKSLMSLLEKGRHHGKYFSSDIEDFIGIRLICVSSDQAHALTHFISTAITEGRAIFLQSAEMKDLHVKDIESASGYKATHITFCISGANFVRGRLGCEIQVRTIFQHAWAQVSESIRYKQRTSGRQLIDKQLRALAARRDEAEKVVAALAETIAR